MSDESGAKPWAGTPSIWDGWTDEMQWCRLGERTCAVGYYFNTACKQNERFLRVRVAARERYGALTELNDVKRWKPEQFRELDREVEWNYQMEKLREQIDAIEVTSKVTS